MGPRLKLARGAEGLSLRGLSDKIGNQVSAQAIGKYERGETMPGSKVLMSLAKALNVSVDYLVGDQSISLKGVEFRKKKSTAKKVEAQLEAKVVYLVERYLLIEELLDLPSKQWDKPRGAPFPVNNDLLEAELAANSLRQHWCLGDDPIPNIVELLEDKGIKVIALDVDCIDGMTGSVVRPGYCDIPVIVVNKNDWSERKRFSIAHEVGHMVQGVGKGIDAERAAHRFAGAFLMPAEGMLAEVGRHRKDISIGELSRLKVIFGTSLQAITYRLFDLGVINRTLLGRLFGEFKSRGWRDAPFKEPMAIDPGVECPKRFERLCFRALSEGVIAEAKAAELLGTSVRFLVKKMDGFEDGFEDDLNECTGI